MSDMQHVQKTARFMILAGKPYTERPHFNDPFED